MKKLLPILLVIFIALILWSWYSSYKRSHPPHDYEYKFRNDIDIAYHNPSDLADYYETGYRVGSFAREVWQMSCIDLLDIDTEDEHSRMASNVYRSMKVKADTLGARLAYSAALKKQGLNNQDILEIEKKGYSVPFYKMLEASGGLDLKPGDKSKGVWKLQEKLIQLGFTMPHDGYYGTETEESVRVFQGKNNLYPSGTADLETLQEIFK